MNKENNLKKQFTKLEIYAALEQAFEAGYYGSLELKDNSLQEIIDSFFDFAPYSANENIQTQNLFSTQQNLIASSSQLDYGNFEFSAYNTTHYGDAQNIYVPSIISEQL